MNINLTNIVYHLYCTTIDSNDYFDSFVSLMKKSNTTVNFVQVDGKTDFNPTGFNPICFYQY